MAISAEIIQQAKTALAHDDKALARQLLKQVLQQEPDNEQALLLYSDVAESSDAAIASLEKVLELNPNNVTARNKLNLLLDPFDTISFDPMLWQSPIQQDPVPPPPARVAPPVKPQPVSPPSPVVPSPVRPVEPPSPPQVTFASTPAQPAPPPPPPPATAAPPPVQPAPVAPAPPIAAPLPPAPMKTCPHCGGQNAFEAKYCQACGNDLSADPKPSLTPYSNEPPPLARVKVVDFDIPFWTLTTLLVKIALAAIPASIILVIIGGGLLFILTFILSVLRLSR